MREQTLYSPGFYFLCGRSGFVWNNLSMGFKAMIVSLSILFLQDKLIISLAQNREIPKGHNKFVENTSGGHLQ